MEPVETVFIGALPFRATEDFIRDLVQRFGVVGAIELHADWVTPTFEPYALVKLRRADQAVVELDGLKIGSIHLRVHKKVPHG